MCLFSAFPLLQQTWNYDVFDQSALPNDDISMKVRVNCICPGIFPSEMTFADTTDNAESLNPVSEGAAKRAPAGT